MEKNGCLPVVVGGGGEDDNNHATVATAVIVFGINVSDIAATYD